MYKRYYDGYTADNDAFKSDNNFNQIDAVIAGKNDIIPTNDAKITDCDMQCTDVITSGLSHNNFNFGGMQTDDLILAGLLILLLFDSDNADITLLIIIGVIFLAGLNI